MCVTCVCANDVGNDTPFENSLSEENLTVQMPATSGDVGTFQELSKDLESLKSGSKYDFKKDYNLQDNDFFHIHRKGIVISGNNIVINGNNHVIDGAHHSSIFNINGDNVTIFNLTFINSFDSCDDSALDGRFNYKYSPVVWNGDNGLMSNCKFINNTGVVGGALAVYGENIILTHNEFINNTATGVGGAVYICGSNSYIAYSNFTNSRSVLSNEVIYYDSANKNNTISNCNFDKNTNMYIFDQVKNMDPRFLFYSSSDTYVGRKYYDIVPLIYKSIRKSGTPFNIDEDSYCFGELNGTEFIFSIVKVFDKMVYQRDTTGAELYISYAVTKVFHFKDVLSYNDIYGKLLEDYDYTMDYSIIAELSVTGGNCYKMAVDNSKNAFSSILPFVNDAPIIFKALSITLNPKDVKVIEYKSTWKIGSLGYDLVQINGNGLTINGKFSDSDETSWVKLDKNSVFVASNLKIMKYNTAVMNDGGTCMFENVTFDSNAVDYWFEKDYGGAVWNKGLAVFNNCTFLNNEAKYGGAIYNEGVLVINDCLFMNNSAYGEGNDICSVKNVNITIDGQLITKDTDIVTFSESIGDKVLDVVITILEVAGTIAAFAVLSYVLTSVILVAGLPFTFAALFGCLLACVLTATLLIAVELIVFPPDDDDAMSDSDDEFIHSNYQKAFLISASC